MLREDRASVDARFQELYRREYAATVRLARMLTGERDDADDLAQDAFVRLFRLGDKVENPTALLRTITVNVCRSWHHSRARSQRRSARYGTGAASLPPFERELDDSLRRLPYEQRAVVVMRYWLRLTEADIAVNLGCRLGTVKSRHARALAALRKDIS